MFCHLSSLKTKENIWYAVIIDLNTYNQLLPYFKILITLHQTVELFKTSQSNRVTDKLDLGVTGVKDYLF